MSMKQQVSLEDGVLAGPGPGPLVDSPAPEQCRGTARAQGWACHSGVGTPGRSQP